MGNTSLLINGGLTNYRGTETGDAAPLDYWGNPKHKTYTKFTAICDSGLLEECGRIRKEQMTRKGKSKYLCVQYKAKAVVKLVCGPGDERPDMCPDCGCALFWERS